MDEPPPVRLKDGFGQWTLKFLKSGRKRPTADPPSSDSRTDSEGGWSKKRSRTKVDQVRPASSGPDHICRAQYKLSPSNYFSAKIEDYSMAPRTTLHYDQIAIPSQPPNVTIPPNAVIDPSHLVPSSAPPHFSTTVTSTPQRVSANPPQKKMVMSFEMENERKHAPEYVYSPGSSPEPSPAPSNDQKPDIIE